MNKFAWNITIKWNPKVDLDFEFISYLNRNWNTNICFLWETEMKSSIEILNFFKKKFEEVLNYDISIESEDKIVVYLENYKEWFYEVVSFEWEKVDFNEILNKFAENKYVVAVREAEISKKFGNRVVKIDFIY